MKLPYRKEVMIGKLRLFFTISWLNIWIASVIAVIIYLAGWGIGLLALLSHAELTRN